MVSCVVQRNEEAAIKESIFTKTWYLEMLAPPRAALPAASDSARIKRLESPSVTDYRRLYRGVGQYYHWVDRLRMPDDVLQKIIADPAIEIDVLYFAVQTAGYVELDGRTPGEIELAYFGLFPEFIGRGLGKYLLSWAVNRAWSLDPQRVWVHTCDLDHPAALRTYLQAGFALYDEKIVEQALKEQD
jgi:GNAT superfamily N-acetyltransferase